MIAPRWMKTAVLGVWALFFVWLLVSGRVNTYIGPRTYWVIVFGAVCLILATIAQVLLRPAEDETASRRWWLGYVAMLVPIFVVFVVPEPSLGSLAASRKSAGGIVSAAALRPPALEPGEEVSFQQISYALESEEYAAALGLGEGYEVDLTGFVSASDEFSSDVFPLTRFSIFCCAADAVPYTVAVRAPSGQRYGLDDWVRVRGVLARDGETFVVQAESVEAVEPPDDPYI